MFEYSVKPNQKTSILTPWNINLKDIKKETEQHANLILAKSTYPNGFYIETHQTSESITFITNWELKDNGDGTMTPIQPS